MDRFHRFRKFTWMVPVAFIFVACGTDESEDTGQNYDDTGQNYNYFDSAPFDPAMEDHYLRWEDQIGFRDSAETTGSA
jgi:hypothetical protein